MYWLFNSLTADHIYVCHLVGGNVATSAEGLSAFLASDFVWTSRKDVLLHLQVSLKLKFAKFETKEPKKVENLAKLENSRIFALKQRILSKYLFVEIFDSRTGFSRHC